jgi:hypothetical protein
MCHEESERQKAAMTWRRQLWEEYWFSAKIENNYDLENLARGLVSDEEVRRIEVEDARIDTGATNLAMPKYMIDQLGFRQLRTSLVKTVAGTVSFGIYGPARLTVQGRQCIICNPSENRSS